MNDNFLQMETEVVRVLKTVYDPEIPVNIFDLGLIYEIKVKENNDVYIRMTLTAPNCPLADNLVQDVKDKVSMIQGIGQVQVELTWEPPWNKDMMSEEGLLELGML